MKKPLILITPQNMPMEEPFDLPYNYSNAYNTRGILLGGGLPVIPPFLTEEMADELMQYADGLFMTGGADIDPARYGEEKMDCCGTIEYDRDASDIALLKAALKYKKPVLCVCRGSQIANVYFGGTLYQDIPTQAPSELKHSVYVYPDFKQENTHKINVVENSPLHKLCGELEFGVNSLHHQAVKTLAPGLVPMAWATDGILESWYLDSEEQWIRAYQWHPEIEDPNPRSIAILKDFVDQCVANRDK
ncbi:MAG: gamma-glutamyl-gamma-aminobutyrate hydrolase family protein [Oscillospiraceae bacterium]|nr:gamma-glutamyl-gamma-aminobutyrate hydrolase family protein [Oscillospiraceae bacterium]